MKVCKISQTQYDYRVVNWNLAVHALYEFNNPLVREGKVASVSSVYTFAFKYEPCLLWQPSLAMVCRNFAVILALGKALWNLVRWFTDQHRTFSFLKIFTLICLWTVMNTTSVLSTNSSNGEHACTSPHKLSDQKFWTWQVAWAPAPDRGIKRLIKAN
jgi:hypothetical protein